MNEEMYIKPSVSDKLNKNRYFEKISRETPLDMAVDKEVQISSLLLRNEPISYFTDYEPPIDADSIKANVNPDELSATRLNAIMSSRLGFYGRLLNVDLTPTQLFHNHVVSIINNTSRGKLGWAGYLAKTSKSVSETTLTEKANDIERSEQKKSVMDKIMRR